MRNPWLISACVVASLPGSAASQGVDWQAGGVAIVTGSEFVGGGVGMGWRPSARMRLGLTAVVGEAAGERAGRFEGALTYYANPLARRIGPYGGGGLAVTVTEAAAIEYVTLFLGIEGNPLDRVGWFAEAGVSGGLRLALGLRIRPGRR